MNDAPSLTREQVAEQLWRWLPAVYRGRDSKGELRAFLGLFADELWRLRVLAEQQYDNQFIDSAQDWAIAYLADLVGTSVLYTGEPARLREVSARNREDVKNTIKRRRSKGTLAGLEGVVADAGGFGVLASEMFERTARLQHGLHLRPGAAFSPDLRDGAALAAIGTPFDRHAGLTDWRSTTALQARARVDRVTVFAWPITSFPLRGVTPKAQGGGRFTFHPLGSDTALLAGGATDHLRIEVAARVGAAGADILYAKADDVPIRTRDLRAHPAAYVDSPLGFALYEDGIPLVATDAAAPAAPSVQPATGFGELLRQRGLVSPDATVFAAGTQAELAVVRLGAVITLSQGVPAPVPYSPGAAFVSQLRLRAPAGRAAIDTVTPDFGYSHGSVPYEPRSGQFHHPVLLLRVSNRGAAVLNWPECEAIVRSSDGLALQVALPAFAALAPTAELHLYAAEDGSTYFARSDHGAGDPDRNPDASLFGAYSALHLARASEGQRRLRPGRPAGAARWRRVVARALCCWDQALVPPPAAGEVAIDPERGRIAFAPAEVPAGELSADFRFGLSAELGAGPFARSASSGHVITVAKRRNADFATLQTALNAVPDGSAAPTTIEVLDSAVYAEALVLNGRNLPGGLLIRAAAGQTPFIVRAQPLRVLNSTVATLALEGLAFAGGPIDIAGAVATLRLRQVTLAAPTSGLNLHTDTPCDVRIERCLVGPLALAPAGSRVAVEDSLVQHPQVAPDVPFGFTALSAGGCDVALDRCTVLGDFSARSARISNSLCLGALVLADVAASCLRYSRLPPDFSGTMFQCTIAMPMFVSLRPGACGHAHLHPHSATVLLQGGEEGGEMGAFAGAGIPWRAQGITRRLAENTPAGLLPAWVWALPRPRPTR